MDKTKPMFSVDDAVGMYLLTMVSAEVIFHAATIFLKTMASIRWIGVFRRTSAYMAVDKTLHFC